MEKNFQNRIRGCAERFGGTQRACPLLYVSPSLLHGLAFIGKVVGVAAEPINGVGGTGQFRREKAGGEVEAFRMPGRLFRRTPVERIES
jgi:hypothetical protein